MGKDMNFSHVIGECEIWLVVTKLDGEIIRKRYPPDAERSVPLWRLYRRLEGAHLTYDWQACLKIEEDRNAWIAQHLTWEVADGKA